MKINDLALVEEKISVGRGKINLPIVFFRRLDGSFSWRGIGAFLTKTFLSVVAIIVCAKKDGKIIPQKVCIIGGDTSEIVFLKSNWNMPNLFDKHDVHIFDSERSGPFACFLQPNKGELVR